VLADVLSEFASRSEFEPDGVSTVLVWRARFAVGRFPRLCGFPPVGPRWSRLGGQCNLSSSFAFLQSLAQRHLVGRPQPPTPLMGFRSLQHIRKRRSTCRGRCRRPLRSALRVWLPSRRFTPSAPLPAFFHTGGAPGIRPSELSPPGRYPPRFRGEGPTCRLHRR